MAGHQAILAIEDSSGVMQDFSKWVLEINIVHNELDAEGSGRDTKTGKMKRTFIAAKHTLNVKMVNHLPQAVATRILRCVHSGGGRTSHTVRYQSPCSANTQRDITAYCSSVNFGAQRYDRDTDECYYDGMTFNLIQM